ncbi:MAG: large conductance mechanosensitive channel protein MscL [Ktedonobacteraceae bacterium]|nr:large conductance mechanosensitive channel protein MscL [Ktedonobacteraceae bacterium]
MNTMRDFGEQGLHSGVAALGGFRKFILRGNVVDLAVGIVIGAAFNSVVQEFVKDLITPLIGIFGGFDFSTWRIPVNHSYFAIGSFLNAVISFLIIAAVVYFFVVLPVNALHDRFTPHTEPAKPTTRECPFCLSTVPLKATRCAYCTAQLPPADEARAQPTSA